MKDGDRFQLDSTFNFFKFERQCNRIKGKNLNLRIVILCLKHINYFFHSSCSHALIVIGVILYFSQHIDKSL